MRGQTQAARTLLCAGAGAIATAASPPPAAAPTLGYESAVADEAVVASVSPRLDAPPSQPSGETPSKPGPATPAHRTQVSLTIDASVTADSNITNGTRLTTIPIDYGGEVLPVPLDPRLRQKSGLGVSLAANASVKTRVADHASLTFSAEGYRLDYLDGGENDDSFALVGGGVELTGANGTGTLQLIAFDRWYGGVSASAGWGLRGSYRRDAGEGRHLTLSIDARIYDSDYGEAFGGRQAGAWLAYDAVLNPTLTAAGGVYVRREVLRNDAFSSVEVGAYGSLSHYLGRDFTGSLSGGISRVVYDAPLLFLSPDPRRDWRGYASLMLATRRPLAWGVIPSLTYTYVRTGSNVAFYRTSRHRLRLGMSRSF